MIDKIEELLYTYYLNQNLGIFRLICDIIIVIGIIILLILFIRSKIKIHILLMTIAGLVALFVLSMLFNLPLLNAFVKYIGFWLFGLYILLYNSEIKALFEGKSKKDRGDSIYKQKKEKEETISVICQTIEYLSKRRIGALITFERKDNLDQLINKAIPINADITQEILTTIFTVGTACHDGGVIIRNNKIACAGAYYPLSDNYDIPKILGTRHRAAIGISERFDAVTIVVSEETGNISLTVAGNISLELTTERVASLLDGYLGA